MSEDFPHNEKAPYGTLCECDCGRAAVVKTHRFSGEDSSMLLCKDCFANRPRIAVMNLVAKNRAKKR